MAVSITRAIKELSAEKYQTGDIIYFFAISLIYVFGFLFLYKTQHNLSGTLLTFLFNFIVSGYYVVAVHNTLCKNIKVFPSLKEFFCAMPQTIKYYVGDFLAMIALFIIPLIIFVAAMIMSGRGIISALMLILFAGYAIWATIFVLVPVSYMYLENFEFSQWFKFKNAALYRKKHKNYISFVLKCLLLFILASVSSVIIAMIFGSVLPQDSADNSNAVKTVSQLVSTYICSCVWCFILPNLIAQMHHENLNEEV